MISRLPLAGIVVGVLTLGFASSFKPSLRLVYNASDSAPRGFYAVAPAAQLQAGDYVIARLPETTASFAAVRSYLPRSTPVLKQIAALAGQHVCIRDGSISIDGVVVARTLKVDGKGHPLTPWKLCRRLLTKGSSFCSIPRMSPPSTAAILAPSMCRLCAVGPRGYEEECGCRWRLRTRIQRCVGLKACGFLLSPAPRVVSLKVMTWAWTIRLPPAPKLVLMALADEADDRGFCFPSHRHLADKCNLSERSVRRVLGLLMGQRHVAIERRFRKDRARTSNGYRLGLDPPGQIVRGPRSDWPGGPDSVVRGPRTAVSY